MRKIHYFFCAFSGYTCMFLCELTVLVLFRPIDFLFLVIWKSFLYIKHIDPFTVAHIAD